MTSKKIDKRVRAAHLEEWLDQHDITWTLDPAVPIDAIDLTGGLVNQVRVEPLHQETVERYRDDIEAGDVFPAVLLRDVDGDLLPIGGNHRLAAHRAAGVPTVAAYRIVCDDVTADLAAYYDNRHHGRPTTLAENVTHAVRLHRNGGLTIADAARAAGISRIHLDHRIGADRATERAQRLGLVSSARSVTAAGHLEWRKLGQGARYHLGRIVDPDVFTRVTELVLNRTLTTTAVEKLAGQLNAMPADAALAYLTEIAGTEEGRVRNTAGRPPGAANHPAAAFRHLLDQVMRYEPDPVAGDCPTPEQRQLTRGQIRAAARKLMAIDHALDTKATA